MLYEVITFYAWLLDELKKHKPWNYVPPVEITVGQQGNLGEFIVDTVLRLKEFAGPEYTFALGGSLTPFQSGTTPGLDMVIVYLRITSYNVCYTKLLRR